MCVYVYVEVCPCSIGPSISISQVRIVFRTKPEGRREYRINQQQVTLPELDQQVTLPELQQFMEAPAIPLPH